MPECPLADPCNRAAPELAICRLANSSAPCSTNTPDSFHAGALPHRPTVFLSTLRGLFAKHEATASAADRDQCVLEIRGMPQIFTCHARNSGRRRQLAIRRRSASPGCSGAHDGFADQNARRPRRRAANVVTRLNAARRPASTPRGSLPATRNKVSRSTATSSRAHDHQVAPASSARASSASSCASQSTSKPWVRAEAASAARSCCSSAATISKIASA